MKYSLVFLALATQRHLRQDQGNRFTGQEAKIEKHKTNIGCKLKLLLFSLGKTHNILESGNVLAINCHRQAPSTIVNQIDILQLQVEERSKEGHFKTDITK